MAKKKESKPRAHNYEEKVKFDGTLEQMIKMAGSTKAPDKDKASK